MASPDDFLSLGAEVYSTYEDIPFKTHPLAAFHGSYGIIYRATAKSAVNNQDVYAIKQLSLQSNQDRLDVAREVRVLQQIRHENVLKLESAFIINDPSHGMLNSICLVTKPWAPWSIERFIRELCQNSVRQCLSGLEYLHGHQPKSIRHKDIKPHNILLSFDPQRSWKEVRPIIIDFGISKEHIDGDTTANTGTYEYKAPEQIKRQEPTLSSDIFSLGCCFALIEGIIRPWPCLEGVYNEAMGKGACQFAENTDQVNSFLDLHKRPSGFGDAALEYFCNPSRTPVRQMLKFEPADRPSAASALKITRNLETALLRQKRDRLKSALRVMQEFLSHKIAFWLGSISYGYIPTATNETKEVAENISLRPEASIRISAGELMMPSFSYCCEHCHEPNLVVEVASSQEMMLLSDKARRYIEGTRGQIRTVVGLNLNDTHRGRPQAAFSVWKAECKEGEWITTTQVDNKEFIDCEGKHIEGSVLALSLKDFLCVQGACSSESIDDVPLQIPASELHGALNHCRSAKHGFRLERVVLTFSHRWTGTYINSTIKKSIE